jgi:hypothetical protein
MVAADSSQARPLLEAIQADVDRLAMAALSRRSPIEVFLGPAPKPHSQTKGQTDDSPRALTPPKLVVPGAFGIPGTTN